MTKEQKQIERKIKRLCKKFHDDLQAIFDSEMDDATYDLASVQAAVQAQAHADDASSD